MKILALAAVLAMPTVAWSQEVIDGSDKNLDAGIVETVMKSTVRGFYDPGSAQFFSLGYQKKSDGTLIKTSICGYVNAKNRLGGYTGIQPFFFDTNTQKATLLPDELKPTAMETFFEFVEAMGCPRP